MKRKLALVLSIMMVFTAVMGGFVAPVFADAHTDEYRIAGANRQLTAYEIAREVYGEGDVETVIIVRGDDVDNVPQIADALAASGLAGAMDAPILLVQQDRVTNSTTAALESLNPTNAIIVGGDAAVNADVEAEIEGMGIETSRVEGINRYATAAAVAEQAAADVDTAIVVQGHALADSMIAGALSHAEGFPILLVQQDRIPQVTADALANYDNFIIVGGEAVVSAGVETELEAMGTVTRIGGENRFETSVLFAEEFFTNSASLSLVNGYSFVDAVASSSLEEPVVYLDLRVNRDWGSEHNAGALAFLQTKDMFKAIGGSAVIPNSIVNAAISVVEGTELEAQSVTEIDGTTFEFTITFNEAVSASEMAGRSVTLTRGSDTFTADFISATGNQATFAVRTADRADMPNGTYNITGNFFAGTVVAPFVVDVDRAETAISGIVMGPNELGVIVALGGVTVTAGEYTAVTDEFGFYHVEAEAGAVDVTFEREGYFLAEDTADVRRNDTTVNHETLIERDVDNIFIESNVIDNATGAGVDEAYVTLEENIDGVWTEIGNVYTDNGYFAFANRGVVADDLIATDLPASPDVELDGVRVWRGLADVRVNGLSFDGEYRIHIEKDILNPDGTFRSFEGNYVELSSDDFAVEQNQAKTSDLYRMDKVNVVDEFNVSVTWTDDAEYDAALTELDFAVIHPDGTPVLSHDGEEVAVTASKLAEEQQLEDGESIDLVDLNFFTGAEGSAVTDVRLPDGTYFLKVDDGQVENAISYVPFEVVGNSVINVNVVIDQAAIANITGTLTERVYASILNGVYDTAAEDGPVFLIEYDEATESWSKLAGEANEVNAVVNAYLVFGDVRIPIVDSGEKAVMYDDEDDLFSVEFSGTDEIHLNRLPAGEIVFEIDGPAGQNYITSAEATTNVVAGSQITQQVGFTAAGQVDFMVTDEDTTAQIDGVTIELIDADGELVNTFVDVDGDFDTDNIAPGNYTVRVSAPGYSTETEDFRLVDWERKTVAVELEADPLADAPVIQGFVRLADQQFEAVNDGKVVAYYETISGGTTVLNSVPVDIVNGYYSLTLPTSQIGETITLVARGEGTFETMSIQHSAVAGENPAVNFEVMSGAKGQFDVVVYNENGMEVTINNIYLQDMFTRQSYTVADVDDEGYFDLDRLGTTNPNYTTGPVLSAGVYELVIEATGYDTHREFITVGKNATVSGGIVQLQLTETTDPSEIITFEVSGTITPDATITDLAAREVQVVAIDADGNVVNRVNVSNDGTDASVNYSFQLRGNDRTYEIVALVDGAFAGYREVTVQDFDRTNISFTVTHAVR